MAEPLQTPSLDEFRSCCDVECTFLVREFGFERLAEPMEYNRYSVRFRKGEFEVDIYGENYGETASCDLVRGDDRLYPGFLIPVTERKAMPSGQLAQVREIAKRLKQYASDFLRGDTGRFDVALAEWKRVTAPRPYTEAARRERELAQAVTLAGHANKRGDYSEVVRLLQPHEASLSQHQWQMLEAAREKLGQ